MRPSKCATGLSEREHQTGLMKCHTIYAILMTTCVCCKERRLFLTRFVGLRTNGCLEFVRDKKRLLNFSDNLQVLLKKWMTSLTVSASRTQCCLCGYSQDNPASQCLCIQETAVGYGQQRAWMRNLMRRRVANSLIMKYEFLAWIFITAS